jgi:hypothetical protein
LLASFRLDISPEAPERGNRGRQLDHAVGAEPNECDASRNDPSRDGDHALETVVSEGARRQDEAAPNEPLSSRYFSLLAHPFALPIIFRWISSRRITRMCAGIESIATATLVLVGILL